MIDNVRPDRVIATLRQHQIADGLPIIFDFERSHGAWVVDASDGAEYLDCYSYFASLPLGFRHPIFDRPENARRLARVAASKPANSDVHSVESATFAELFAREAMPEPFRYLFFIEGGALAVENALKAAFDWKVRKNLAAGRGELGSQILHFAQAFHGRSGYTMSLTNTEAQKIAYYPKFAWPRVHNPALRFPLDDAESNRVAIEEQRALAEIAAAFDQHGHDIAAIIIEPIQGEGGDNHFRPAFFAELRRIADECDALLIFDEVQTGFGITGKFWAFEHLGVTPDIISFGKKSQVCGIMAGPRIDEVPDNVFHVSSRINSTWGGSLVDMVRCQIILEAMREEHLVDNAATVGALLQSRLTELATEHPDVISNVRGRGLLCAFDLPTRASRDAAIVKARAAGLLVLGCGERSLRLRPTLTFGATEVDEVQSRLRRALA